MTKACWVHACQVPPRPGLLFRSPGSCFGNIGSGLSAGNTATRTSSLGHWTPSFSSELCAFWAGMAGMVAVERRWESPRSGSGAKNQGLGAGIGGRSTQGKSWASVRRVGITFAQRNQPNLLLFPLGAPQKLVGEDWGASPSTPELWASLTRQRQRSLSCERG